VCGELSPLASSSVASHNSSVGPQPPLSGWRVREDVWPRMNDNSIVKGIQLKLRSSRFFPAKMYDNCRRLDTANRNISHASCVGKTLFLREKSVLWKLLHYYVDGFCCCSTTKRATYLRAREGWMLPSTAVTGITYYATITSNTMASSMCPVVHTVWSIYYLRFIIIPFPHFLL